MPQPTTITTHARPASDAALMTHSLASATEVVSEPTMTPLSPPSPSVSGLFLSSSSNTEWTDEMLRLLCGSPAVGPNVFGIPCSTAAQRAYSKYSLETQQGFKRLQTQDSGTVEHRTIAFSTHLTISRWEPVAPAATPLSKTQSTIGPENTSEMTTEPQDNAPSQVAGRKHIQGSPRIKQEASSPKSDPVLAARLMSLANYIRHIVSLTSGNSPVHTASELVYRRLQQLQQQQQQQREHKLRATLSPQPRESLQPVDQSRAPCETAAATALPSPLSARPGPIRSSDLTKRYRGQSEYADHRTRRLQYHSQQQSQQSSSDLHAAMPSPISPLVNLKKAGRTFSVVSGAEKKPSLSPLLKTPFPNITLTLALIYVDRLKAKYPEAKGEQGCSHRLFLVAYIIAAKYRCTVELASLMRECEHVLRRQFRDGTDNDNEQDEQDVYNAPSRDYEDLDQTTGDRSNGLENPLKAALKQHRRKEGRDAIQELKDALARAEVVFSNYEWVRLLSLGSFFRPPAPPASTPTLTQPVTTASNKSMYASDPTLVAVKTEEDDSITRPLKPSAKSLPINASPRAREEDSDQNDCGFKKLKVDTSAFRAMTAPAMATPLTASAMTSGLLQVEDLDRMEAEFLTFLDFDLCSRSQDLDTCWSLLVGNKN
ncbi:hypothetical protein BGW38_004770 [Lunasporangiospora selenospora]|uniref:Uncharacterized protein n=1 Tax=Lunasporangiospora selenospora TaxID=979761 RepID=A0A9P6KBX4_9FUNG|nr:hypothetical protein BGW38_004770 [Lunasporangiospora selenospora]